MSASKIKIYPIIVILLCAGFLFFKYILQMYPGIITEQLMEEFNVDGAGLGNLAANYFYAYLVAQLFVGILLDKYNSRWLISVAILVGAVGAILFAETHSLGVAQFGRILMGFSSAFATVCYLKSTALWFKPQHFAFVGGLLATAAMVGAIFGEAPLSILVNHLGWRQSVMIIGFLGIVLAVLFALIIRDKKQVSAEIKYGVSFKDFLAILRRPQNWVLTLFSGLAFTPLAVFGGLWGNPFLVTVHHISTTAAATLISCAFLGFGIGSPILGFISDRLQKRRPVMFWGTFVSFVSIALVIYVSGLPEILLGLLLFLFGFGIGAFMLCFAVGKDLNPLIVTATVIAMINTGDSFFGSFTEPLIGKILDWQTGMARVDVFHTFSIHAYQLGLSLLPLYLVVAMLSLIRVSEK